MQVFLLWHVRHARSLDGSPTVHRQDGELVWDEQDGDDVKILGVYSSERRADERIAQARGLPGFADEPDCFMVAEYALDEDLWTDGFVVIPHED